MLIWRSVERDGTPAALSTNRWYVPGGVPLARAGSVAVRTVADLVNGNSMKRWSMFTLCVVDPVFTSVTRLISVAFTSMLSVDPTSAELGAVTICGRVAKLPDELNRY